MIAALVTVVVVVGAVILWRFFGDALSHRSQAGAARCVSGEVAVAVVADPSIADQIAPAGRQVQQVRRARRRPVRQGRRQARRLRSGGQRLRRARGPANSASVPRCGFPAARSPRPGSRRRPAQKTISDSRSLVTSPVLLAVRPQLKDALAQQNWGTLPGLQTNPSSLDGLNLPGWGSLRLALPLPGDSDATYLAAEAVAAASAPPGAPATPAPAPSPR